MKLSNPQANHWNCCTFGFSLNNLDWALPTDYSWSVSPSLTIDYQTALVAEDTTTLITDVIETQTQNEIMNAAAGGIDPTPPPITVVVPAFQTYTTTASTTPVDTPVDIAPSSTPVFTAPIDTTSASTETTMTSAPVIETAAAAPTIAPVAQQTETQQAEETQAETQIETAMQPTETSSTETTTEIVSEPSTPKPESTPKAVAKGRPQKTKGKTKTARKTVATATTTTVPVSVPVTPAAAAQAVVSNIAPSQKYGSTAQTVTLVAMGMIANNRGLFKSPSIPDVANFFSSSSVPDGPSMVDPMQNYQVFGQSNGLHNELVESQWSK